MGNTLKAIAFLLLGAAAYHFLRPVFVRPAEQEQFLLGPQIYLHSIENAQAANLDMFFKGVESINQELSVPKPDPGSVRQSLQSYEKNFKQKRDDLNESKWSWMEKASIIEKYIVVPPAPIPHPPCKGGKCMPLDIRKKRPFFIYHSNPATVTILDSQGKELASSMPGSAGQVTLADGVVKITLDLKNSGFTGDAVLTIRGPQAEEGPGQIAVNIQ